MQNLSTTYAGEIRECDEIFVPAGLAFTALIDARDIGRVAAGVFGGSDHVRRSYTLSGEQSLTYTKIARILTAELGRNIRYAGPSEQEYLASLAAKGLPADYVDVQKMIYRVVRWNISAFPSHTVSRQSAIAMADQPTSTLDRASEGQLIRICALSPTENHRLQTSAGSM